MFKRNKFEQQNGALILYPDYGNLKGFAIIGIVAILFCYGLYQVNATHHHIGTTKMFYICLGTVLLILLGFATAYKKVIIDTQKQKVVVWYFGIQLKEIPFEDILTVEMRSGSLPDAYYIVLKKNPIGHSIRLSATYNQTQQIAKSEFYHQVLPLIKNYLLDKIVLDDHQNEPIQLKHFKQRAPQLYRFVSIHKIILAVIQLAFAGFFFALMANFLFAKFAFTEIIIGLFSALVGLYLLLLAFINAKNLYVDTNRKIIAETFFGFLVVEFPFNAIEKAAVRDHRINGISMYTSLVVYTKDDSAHVITKSFSTQHLTDVERELQALMQGNIK
ncbi:hypothetical protein [Pedobacter ureilyticus]|uniref:DUF304 domain-containing protein n=1 Tax=Pedobacter ureilyticus TaxID=1393051 RepID=A0ABW9J695_9SPHI|nr:hypothetical protein [Pedobacter helvus]